MHQTPSAGPGNPPPYEATPNQQPHGDNKQPLVPPTGDAPGAKPTTCYPVMMAGPSYVPQHQGICSPTLFHYTNPTTGEHVTSLLPPDHPEMVCLQQGGHLAETKYGLLGVLAAIFWFPLGIGLCLLDRRVRCARCGVMIEDGMCNL